MTKTSGCSQCEKEFDNDWNLAPLGATRDGKSRTYLEDVFLCDDCYDVHCTKYNIQPLLSEESI